MPNKKKTTTTREAKYAKAGDKRRNLHVPVYRTVEVADDKTGKRYTRKERCKENERRGPGSNRERKYNGSPLDFYV